MTVEIPQDLEALVAGLPPIRVSLTTMRSRLTQLPHVLESLHAQSLRPRRVVLAVSEEPYALDEGITLAHLPRRILAMAETGWLDILFTANTGPYRKLVPVLPRDGEPEQLIATADDDTIYPPAWLESMVRTYADQQCVIAHRCRAMTVKDGQFVPYRDWPSLRQPQSNYGQVRPEARPQFTLPTGVRGVLYNTGFFDDRALLARLAALAPLQDDLAFKAMMLCRGIGTVLASRAGLEAHSWHFDTPKNAASLFHSNRTANDGAWSRIQAMLEAEGRWRLSDYLLP